MSAVAWQIGPVLPWAPRILWPNGSKGHHWAQINRARRQQHRDALILLRAARLATDPAGPVPVTLTFIPPPRVRRFDLDGALGGQKAALDALAEVLGCDDSRFALTLARGERDGRGGVRVDVGRLDKLTAAACRDGWQTIADAAAPTINRIIGDRA